MKFRQLFLALVLQQLFLVSVEAQTLRVGLANDPDILDPATNRLFVSRLVLATFATAFSTLPLTNRSYPN